MALRISRKSKPGLRPRRSGGGNKGARSPLPTDVAALQAMVVARDQMIEALIRTSSGAV
jgi:hypothetical protein